MNMQITGNTAPLLLQYGLVFLIKLGIKFLAN